MLTPAPENSNKRHRSIRLKTLLVFLTCISFSSVSGQSPRSDLQLISDYSVKVAYSSGEKKEYAFRGKPWYIKYNPISLIAGGSLFLYQAVISPQLMQGCAFHPSCSHFSRDAIAMYGVLKGFALSTDRLTRCTRLSSIDFHPLLIGESGKVTDPPGFYTKTK